MIRLLWLDYYKLSLYLYLCLCLCCVLPLQKRRWQGWGVSIIRERWYVARRAMSDPPSFLLMVSLLVCPLSIFSFLPDFYLIFTWLLIVRLVCPLSTFSFLHFYSPHWFPGVFNSDCWKWGMLNSMTEEQVTYPFHSVMCGYIFKLYF